MTISERLVAVREENGYTRKRLAEELNRPYRTVTNYETGEREPGHEYIIEIAKKFGVTTDYLLGISEEMAGQVKKITTPLSDAALRLADDYDHKLDRWGRQAVRDLCDTEIARCEDETRFMEDTAPPKEDEKIIPLYRSPAAAGLASPIFGEEFEYYTMQPDDPKGADFAIRLQGDSMEPYLPDGSVVFCNRDPLADGDIGIFSVDGEAVCKQYHHDRLGMTYLFSLNRNRSDADVVLPRSTGRNLVCFGRVMTERRYPLPR